MEALSGEYADEYYKDMDYEFDSLIIRYTWEIVSRKSVDYHNFIPGTWYLKCKTKAYWTISKFKAQYCVRGDVHNRLSPEPLNSYSLVVQWSTVRLMLILYFILCLQSQSIEFTNNFLRQIFQVGNQSSLSLPGISIVMEENVMLFSG